MPKANLPCAIGLIVAMCGQAQSTGTFEGYWRGSVALDSGSVEVGLDISRIDNSYVATADDITRHEYGIPVTFLVVLDREIHMEHPTYKTIFDAKLNADGQEIRGILHYGKKYALNLRRAPRPPALPKTVRPQEPTGALPYTVDGVAFAGRTGGIRLRGTIATPKGAGPFPAAVLVNMAGNLDRDETIAGHKPYLVLSDYLARHGIATLRVDARGMGPIAGGSYPAESIETMADDALAALSFLRVQRDVDPKRAGFIGHGEGGLAASIAASLAGEPTFLVLLGSPGLRADQLELNRAETNLRLVGAPTETIEWWRNWLRGLIAIVQREPDKETARVRRAELMDKAKSSRPERTEVFLSEADIEATIERINSRRFAELLKHDPASLLSRLKIPVLAVAGSRDAEMPSSGNLPAIFAALSQAESRGFEVKELPGLNHLFQRCVTCKVDEYRTLSETFSPVAAQAVVDWLQRTGAGDRPSSSSRR